MRHAHPETGSATHRSAPGAADLREQAWSPGRGPRSGVPGQRVGELVTGYRWTFPVRASDLAVLVVRGVGTKAG